MSNPDVMVRKKPLFPIMYGFFIQDIRDTFNDLAKKRLKITQEDIMELHSKISNLEAFIKYLISINMDYDSDKKELIKEFDEKKSLYGQLGVLRAWFGLLNTVVGDMYFDVAGIDRYEADFESHKGKYR